MLRIAIALAIWLMMVPPCPGQTKAVPAHQRQVTPPGKIPTAQALKPDAAVEAAIRAKFAKSKISVEKFQVRVQGGVATIEGHTDVVQHKGVATRLAKTGGAIAVNNHIQISEAAKQKSAANLATGRRRVQVTRGAPRSDPGPARQTR